MQELAEQAKELVTQFEQDNADILPEEVHHIGALVLRERMLAEPDLLREYDRRKLRAAARGAAAYWDAKNSFLQELLAG